MALYYNLPVYKASYKLVYMLFESSGNFSREYKYTVGEKIKDEGVFLVKNIYRANKAEDKTIHIKDARENIETIRLFVRLMQDFKQLGLKPFVEINQEVEMVSKQLTAWEKYSKNQLSTPQKGESKNIVGKVLPELSVARAQMSVHSNSNNPLAYNT